jgi:hypothetical protein
MTKNGPEPLEARNSPEVDYEHYLTQAAVADC